MVIPDAACPPEQQIAALVDGALSEAERAQLLSHVDQCAACFDLVATVSVLHRQPLPVVDRHLRDRVLAPRRLPGLLKAAPALAAAAALLVAVVWWRQPAPGDGTASAPVSTRAPENAGTRARAGDGIEVEQPADGDLVKGRPEIRWNAPPEAVAFEIVVTSSTGDVLWQQQLPGTSRSARLTVDLPSKTPCYLWVAASLPEGRRLTSNVVKIHAVEP